MAGAAAQAATNTHINTHSPCISIWALLLQPETDAQRANRREQAALRSKIIALQRQAAALNSQIVALQRAYKA
jgi:hypothetical protein